MKFDEFELDERLLKAVADLGFEECTEVQERSLEHTLKWRDVTAQSQTGTGKTAAFLLTILQHFTSRPELTGRQALIIAPTRELAVQIEEEAQAIGKYLEYRSGSIYGGVGYGPQEQMLRDNVEIIVGTPGRLIDLSKSGKLDFGNFAIVVIDEADRLFDMGFYPDIRYILQRTPPKDKRLTLLFSATLNTNVRNISWQYMNDPAEVEVAPEHITVQEVDQTLYHVSREEKISLLLGILAKEKPENALIFTNTKRAAELISKKLKGNGYQCEFIMGDVPQRKRLRIINNLKSGNVPYLVATDVAARGLHIEDLDLVVNYDLPEDVESYVHRIGRTARAGKTGKAVSLACERFVYSLESIEEFVGFKIPVGDLSEELFVEDQSHVAMRDLQYHSDGRSGGRSSRSRSSSPRRSGPKPPRHGGGGRRDSRHEGSSEQRDRPPTEQRRSASPNTSAGPNKSASPKPRDTSKPRSTKSEQKPSTGAKKGRPPKGGPSSGPSKSAPMEERLAYYREKYGEDFQHTGSTGGGSKRKSSSSKGREGGAKRQPAASKKRETGKQTAKPSEPKKPSKETDESAPDKKRRKRGVLGALSKLFGNGGEKGGDDN